jgi:mycothiol synthase
MTTETFNIIARTYSGDSDLQAICNLLNLCAQMDITDDSYTVEDLRHEYNHPKINKAKDLRLWESSEGLLLGFGQVWLELGDENKVDGIGYFRVHPKYRHTEIADQIIGWQEQRVGEESAARKVPGNLYNGSRSHLEYTKSLLEKHHFNITRYFFRMVRPLNEPIPEPHFPEGYTLRHVSSEQDLEKWVETYNLSFIDHWNHNPTELEEHKYYLKDEKYNQERDLVLVAPDSTFAGFCFCQIDPDANILNNRKWGWIDLLGTRRGYRGLGLGKGLLLAGMRRLKAEGMEAAVLGVDAENPSGALQLYESIGFTKVYTNIVYCKVVYV